MVGGDAAVLDGVRPVLDTFGQKIVHCGEIGAGDSVKAVNNAFLATHHPGRGRRARRRW